jgi:transcriptional regulator with XRE-family HTH domain
VADLYRLLGRNIAHFRREAKLTQEELAEKTDYSVDFIGLVERGVNAPTVARLKDIADVIGVEIWELFYPDTVSAKQTATSKKSHTKGTSGKRQSR